jgi:glycosyltransferase involved in cell wall biosynthesis
MAEALRQAAVVVNTSRSEGLSNALMEAMSVGTPILANDIPGNRDLLRDGETGLLYRGAGDYRAKLSRLLDVPALGARLGAAAAAEAGVRFSTGREAEAVLAAYEEALRPV